jgi:hypothetical protein
MHEVQDGIPPEHRARLAHKGRLLYEKFCGTGGPGGCAEGFALYHIRRGEGEVARDLLAFLEARVEDLRRHDPEGRLALTEDLAARVRRHLEGEAEGPPDPSHRASLLKAKERP